MNSQPKSRANHNTWIPLLLFALLGLACNQDTISPPARDPALALGNPAQDQCDADHVLIEHAGYVTYYSHKHNAAEWSAWHLSAAWLGDADRSTAGFPPDNTLPAGWYRAKQSDYTGTGFDRGHLCNSADRTATDALNAETFILSNIIPQVPDLNRKVWERSEQWDRDQVATGQELYIVAGGSGSLGKLAGNINVPDKCWRVVLALPDGDNDLSRIDKNTTAFGVIMPNSDTVTRHEWTYYKVPIADVEALTGFRFFANLPANVRAALLTKKP